MRGHDHDCPHMYTIDTHLSLLQNKLGSVTEARQVKARSRLKLQQSTVLAVVGSISHPH